MPKKKAILFWSQDDGALYHPSNVDHPVDPNYWSRLEVTLDENGKVSLTLDDLASGQNDISNMLVTAGKARFLK